MKLLIIVLCLLSERYLVHAISYSRFYWFNRFFDAVTKKLPSTGIFTNSYVVLALIILPFLLIIGLLLVLFSHTLFGFIGLLLNLAIFYYCLGPVNSFYPVNTSSDDLSEEMMAGNYFADVNHQLFSVIFWFILSGPLGVLCYRLLYLCKEYPLTQSAALQIIGFADWISARLTLLLYLLVGNFQQGLHYYTRLFFSSPENNHTLLSNGGLLAARTTETDIVSLPHAQNLVEHALIIYMVFLAFFTLVAWL